MTKHSGARKAQNGAHRLFGLLVLALASCAGAPQYDATADAKLSALQNEVDSKMVQLISWSEQGDAASQTSGSYAQTIVFYNKFDTDLEALELRMEAVPDASNANLPTIFDNIRQELSSISTLHKKENTLPDVFWIPTRNQFNAQFAVLLTYELSLKGVKSPSSSSTKSSATASAAAKAANTSVPPPK